MNCTGLEKQETDELGKNHCQNDNNFDTIGEGAMYEIPESETCKNI